ncbi:MAG TPA: ABC transporter ATP-binding protein [Acidimicrobiales bacterium]|nr:ABC transporter ATP-binding protein [Acidimicrobiales bacterium]
MSEASESPESGGRAMPPGPARSAAAPQSTLEVCAATKQFGAKTALDAVDLRVEPGSFCVLLGPSGSGKTTLLRCVAGIERLTTGRVYIGDRLVADGPAHHPPERRELAMVFQDYALWPHLSVIGNVEFALRRRHHGRDEARRRSQKMLDRVGLGRLTERYPNELSGGEQQRVALARALVAATGLVLFDEPLSNLDADLRERMRLEIATLTRDSGATTVYITHDQSEAFALADTIGVLSHGRLVQFGTPEEIYHHPASPFVARFTGLAGEIPVTIEGPAPSAADPRVPGGATRRVAVRPRAGVPDSRPVAIETDAPSGNGLLLVRPSAVDLLAPGHADRHLDAVVLDSAYRGRGYDHALLLTDGTQLVGVHDLHRWDRGSNVALRLTDSGCLLFPPDGPDAGEDVADLPLSAPLAMSNGTAPS